jgi:hypothetical protein
MTAGEAGTGSANAYRYFPYVLIYSQRLRERLFLELSRVFFTVRYFIASRLGMTL